MALKNGTYVKRYLVEIENISPLHIGGEDGELLLDDDTREIYLPGTTVAGALRSYLESVGFDGVQKLFGSSSGDSTGRLSKIFVYDSFSKLSSIEVRPGVHIDGFSGAAIKGGKFDRTFVGEGHKFELEMEAFADTSDEMKTYDMAIRNCIYAINKGIITFGSYENGGAGFFKVNSVKASEFDFNIKKDLFDYLKCSRPYEEIDLDKVMDDFPKTGIVEYELKGITETPLLIKGTAALDENRADSEQIQNSIGEYIIPGTSIKGIVRARGESILKYFNKSSYINEIFGGVEGKDKKYPSRFTAYDAVIKESKETLYSRIKNDRFTGGVMNGQKMEEKVVSGSVVIKGKLKTARLPKEVSKEEAIALIALVFRDIAIGDLPIGSGNNVGRGRIQGHELTISEDNKVLYKWDIKNNKVLENHVEEYIKMLSAGSDK